MILSQLHLAALTAERSTNRPAFQIYVDECHHFGASTLPEMLSGIRKFGVSLVLAHQYLDQLLPTLKAALLGTVGTIIAFRIGARNVAYIEPEFRLTNDDYSLCELAPFEAYARSGFTTHRLAMPMLEHRAYPGPPRRIRNQSRNTYATDREAVEPRIAKFIAAT